MPEEVIAIAGAGAAGIFAAVTCAEAAPEKRVIVFEKGEQILQKVKISGGGRCNVTHGCFDPKELVKHYPRGERELLGPFHRWQPADTMSWFEERGVALKIEDDGRVFPESDRSQSIIDALLSAARRHKVEIITKRGLIDADPKPDGSGFWLTLEGEETIDASHLLIASGSLRSSKSRTVAEKLGHTIAPLVPSLFTFRINDPRIKSLPGTSVTNAQVELLDHDSKLVTSGPLLITHWGMSGPAILRLSAWGARELAGLNYEFSVRVNWLPAISLSEKQKALQSAGKDSPRKRVKNANPFSALPLRLWERLVEAADIREDTTWATLDKRRVQALALQLDQGVYDVRGKSTHKDEFVTCGGIELNEIDFRRMESKRCPRLHVAGESLNIDGITGGFNFQAAWTTGRIAGLAMAGMV